MSAIGGNSGINYNAYISNQYGQNQIQQSQVQQQAGLKQTGKALGTKSPLDVGFERKDSVATKVASDAGKVANPIVDADEAQEFVAFEANTAKSASKSTLSTALSMEAFDPDEFGGNGLQNAAAGLIEGKFSATDGDVAKMENMVANMSACPMGESELSGLRSGLQAHLGVKLSENSQAGELSLLAAVASAGGNIHGMVNDDGSINADKLMGGVAQVLRDGGKAINTASDMAGGVSLQMNAFRTMLPTR